MNSNQLALLLLIATTTAPRAATLSCTTAPGSYIPRWATYTETGPVLNKSTANDPSYPTLFFIATPVGATAAEWLGPAVVQLTSVTISDSVGTTYAPLEPWVYMNNQWFYTSRTPMPVGVTPTMTYTYRYTPTDGTTYQSAPDKLFGGAGMTTYGTPGAYKLGGSYAIGQRYYPEQYPDSEISYQVPDRHDFGDIAPGFSGVPLILPRPSKGTLKAYLFWSGSPRPATMSYTVGTNPPVTFDPGTGINVETAGQGLRLDFNTVASTSPGTFTGNATMTLTCP